MKRMTSVEPCKHDKHKLDGNYLRPLGCGTPYCSGSESRCLTCRWFITECGCGSSNGASGRSERFHRTIRRKRALANRGAGRKA